MLQPFITSLFEKRDQKTSCVLLKVMLLSLLAQLDGYPAVAEWHFASLTWTNQFFLILNDFLQ